MRIERFWPRWLCWMLGHEPTEWHDFERMYYRCRCGAEIAGDEVVWRRGGFNWWRRLVERLP